MWRDLRPMWPQGGSWDWASVQGRAAVDPPSLVQTAWQVEPNKPIERSLTIAWIHGLFCIYLDMWRWQRSLLRRAIFRVLDCCYKINDRSRTALRRVVGDAPIFGMHYSLSKSGSVARGDKVHTCCTWNLRPSTIIKWHRYRYIRPSIEYIQFVTSK